MTLGTTFVNLNAASYPHLWVVVTNPTPADSVVIFNLSTNGPGCDQTCLIFPGDHPWVRHESYVCYLRGREMGRCAWDTMTRMGAASVKAPASLDLVKRIQAGSLASPHTTPLLQRLVRADLLP